MEINRAVEKDEYVKQLFNLQQKLIEYDKIEDKDAIKKHMPQKIMMKTT